MTNAIYTIGHSTHSIETFVGLLVKHCVSAICDVRSRPYSRMNPQFNREELKNSLKNARIKYVFLGKELGARSEDKSCYKDGQVQYDLLAQSALFRRGVERLIDGSSQYRIALMCAEKEPLDCHRTILVARALWVAGLEVRHILGDGQIEDHTDAIGRLIRRLRVPGTDMFRDYDAVIAEAYSRQAREIAYREEVSDDNSEEKASQQKLGAAE